MVKVTVLGAAGGIGQPLSLLLRLNEDISELNLFDIANPAGIATDLSHIPSKQVIRSFTPKDKNETTQLSESLKGSQVVIIPAGIPRKPGMTRDDLFKVNASIVKSLVNQAGLNCPDAFICVISNPVNSTVPIAVEQLKDLGVYNPKKVFGVTTLDNLRLEQFLSESIAGKVSPADLKGDVFTIGGHSGETIVPIINSWSKSLSVKQNKDLIKRVQFGGDEVVKAKGGAGSATLSMATAAYRFATNVVAAIVHDRIVDEVAFVNISPELKKSLPKEIASEVSYFSLPLKLDKNGIQSAKFPARLSPEEQNLVKIAVAKLKADVSKGVKFVKGSKL